MSLRSETDRFEAQQWRRHKCVPDGYAIVPLKPTFEMRVAAARCPIVRPDRNYPLWSILADQDERGTVLTIDDILAVYTAMLQAVAEPPREMTHEEHEEFTRQKLEISKEIL